MVKVVVLIIKEKKPFELSWSKNHQLPYVENRSSKISQRWWGDMETVLGTWLPTDKVNRKVIARCKNYRQSAPCNWNQQIVIKPLWTPFTLAVCAYLVLTLSCTALSIHLKCAPVIPPTSEACLCSAHGTISSRKIWFEPPPSPWTLPIRNPKILS